VAVRQRGLTPAKALVITIDGPAGVGKSTAAKLLARRLGLTYLDTGATYRALAYTALQADLNPVVDAARIARLGRRLPLSLAPDPAGGLRVRLNGTDVTAAIRTEEVTEAAAQIAQHPDVRAAMVALQRRLAIACSNTTAARGSGLRARGPYRLAQRSHRGWPTAPSPQPGATWGVVVEGRDTGSVVFPRATAKFFLDADPTVRARRRQRELAHLYGSRPPLAQVREQLHFRDGLDKSRRVGPLTKPRGAMVLDTTHLTAPQVVQAMLRRMAAAEKVPGCSVEQPRFQSKQCQTRFPLRDDRSKGV